jgi:tRNA A-37 threonylcarbamoyl transferase component Bud32
MIYIKNYIDRGVNAKRHFGLTHQESFELELTALKKVQGYSNMCQLIDYDTNNLTLHLEYAGQNLNYYIDKIRGHQKEQKRLGKKGLPQTDPLNISDFTLTRIDFVRQIEYVFDIFKSLNIVHFDLGPWNICTKNNQITIIDFGCVVLDGNIKAECLKKPYEQFLSDGGWDVQKEKTISRIDSRLFNLL